MEANTALLSVVAEQEAENVFYLSLALQLTTLTLILDS